MVLHCVRVAGLTKSRPRPPNEIKNNPHPEYITARDGGQVISSAKVKPSSGGLKLLPDDDPYAVALEISSTGFERGTFVAQVCSWCSRKRAVIYFEWWVFFLIPLGSPHVRCTPMVRACGEPDEIELTAIGVELNGSHCRHCSCTASRHATRYVLYQQLN